MLVVDDEAEAYAAAIEAACDGVRVIAARTPAEACARGGEADMLAALAPVVIQELIDAMPRLRWIQALTTGTDQLDRLRLPPGTLVTSARGIHGPQMAELAFLHMLALARDFRVMLENQAAARWQRWPQRLLLGKTAVLVGVGAISEELALRCHAFGMRVIGVSEGRQSAPGFDLIVKRAALASVAAQADFLVVLAPYSRATHHMIDAAVLAAMRADSFLVNVARGSVVDEAALVQALDCGRIAGAGLDVFATEPLPATSPLWSMPKILITPHVGGMSDIYAAQVTPLLLDNIRAYLAQDEGSMRNVVRAA